MKNNIVYEVKFSTNMNIVQIQKIIDLAGLMPEIFIENVYIKELGPVNDD